MKIVVIGAGNIGLVTALCFAKAGHNVFCIDNNQNKIDSLKNGVIPFFEAGLKNLLDDMLQNKHIIFSSALKDAIPEAQAVFLAVGTPNLATGAIDLMAIDSVVQEISTLSNGNSLSIIIRSTVPPRTQIRLATNYPHLHFISSPEFLREGSALLDCLHPHRILVGSHLEKDLSFFKDLYEGFHFQKDPFVLMDPTSAEITKYASNIFLAARISLINEMAKVCEKSDANILSVQKGIGLDPRIGCDFLNAGLGYGGSCFAKDMSAFMSYAESINETLAITAAVQKTNEDQIDRFTKKIIRFFEKSDSKSIAIWGASFKPETDDLREAPSLKMINQLTKEGFKIKVYDPQAQSELKKIYTAQQEQVFICEQAHLATVKSDALVIATEWPEFKNYPLKDLLLELRNPVVFDGRNIFNPVQMKDLGFQYYPVGYNA